jgi:hypothetical protein
MTWGHRGCGLGTEGVSKIRPEAERGHGHMGAGQEGGGFRPVERDSCTGHAVTVIGEFPPKVLPRAATPPQHPLSLGNP